MNKKFGFRLAILLVIAMLFTVSCSKKAVKPDDAQSDAEKARQEELARQRALEEANLEAKKQQAMMARQQFMNEDVYFEFDSSVLMPAAQDVLRKKAEWLRENAEVTAVIEGHCDERGTTEYNLALGDRRAESARTYLMDLGIAGSRMSTISYGEEKPLDSGNTEAAWAKNRRVHFVVQ